ncbi:MAG: glycyl-radical enzyme activating protein [Chloroflexota bacterium]
MSEPTKGLVFDIQRYSIHDGPGIRTLVFLKGCPLRCEWCCNPESQGAGPEIEFRSSLCQQCGHCLLVCPRGAVNVNLNVTDTAAKIDRNACDACGLCAEGCPTGALRLVGRWLTVDDVMREVLRDAAFYRRSGGGVTLSGGEPLAQPGFAAELLRACYEHNIGTAVETAGLVGWPAFEQVLPYVETFLYDVKHMDDVEHRRLTGVSNRLILENLRRLRELDAAVILRLPLIPPLNTSAENLGATADLAAELGIKQVHLMPFHQLGKDKYRRLGLDYELAERPGLRDTPEGSALLGLAQTAFARRGLEVHVGG